MSKRTYSRNWPRMVGLGMLLALVVGSGCNFGRGASSNSTEKSAETTKGTPKTGEQQTAARSGSPQAVPVRFTDVSLEAGIDFLHQNSKTPRKYLIETMGSGGAFLDYDNDGRLDVLLLNNRLIEGGKVNGKPGLKLYRNLGGGKFKDVTPGSGLERDPLFAMGTTVGDFDRDGKQDIYITTALDGSRLFRNLGGGKFQDVTGKAGVANKGRWGTSCAWVDYDKDGWLDLFVCNYVKYASLKDDQPCRSGDQIIYCIPSAYDTSQCVLYHNEKNGVFKDVTEAAGIKTEIGSKGLGVSIWDYNDDGWPDIFVANDTVPGFLFRNLGNGKFQEVGTESAVAYNEEGVPHSGMGIDAADAGNDGKTTLVITNYFAQQTSCYHQTDKEVFRDDRHATGIGPETARVLGFGILFFDFDNDGRLDILQANGHVQDDIEAREPGTPFAEVTQLFHNQGNGTFVEVGVKSGKPFSERIVGRGAAWGDYDNDGKLDVLVTTNNGRAMLWHNGTPTRNHWLTLRLVSGGKSAPDGLGAVVVVKAGGVTQRRMVRCGSSYLCQSDLRPHFGLGAQASADIEVRWPSGTVDRINGVGADQIVTIHEGKGKIEGVAVPSNLRSERIATLHEGKEKVE